MPLKLSVHLSRKMGLPAYSSLAASCGAELELSNNALDDLEGFHHHVRLAYTACRTAVEEELQRHLKRQEALRAVHDDPSDEPSDEPSDSPDDDEAGPDNPPPPATGPAQEASGRGGNGHAPAQASARQLEYARQLASQIPGLGLRRLERLAQDMLGQTLAEISSPEASVLIKTLQNVKAGLVDLEGLLEASSS